MKTIWILFLHEIRMRFRYPYTWAGLAAWLFLTQAAAFGPGGLLTNTQANLWPLFLFLPLIGVFFLPLLTMGQWAQAQTLNALPWFFSFPIHTWMVVFARFLVANVLTLFALCLTVPLAITVANLGNPDWGMIVAGYIACYGCFSVQLASGALASALCRHQLLAYVTAALFNLLFLGVGSHLLYEGWPNLLPLTWSDRLLPFGAPYHLLTGLRGVVEIRDILFWAGWTLLCLLLTSMVLYGRRTLHRQGLRDAKAAFSVLCLALLTLLCVLLGRDLRLRWDLTEENLYTISSGSRSIIRRLQQPVTMTFYFSRSHTDLPPVLKAYGQRVEEFLREYAAVDSQKFRYRSIDPPRDSEQELAARALGVPPVTGTTSVYFGAILRQGSRVLALPFLDPAKEDQLEYDLTEALVRIQQLAKPALGIMSDLPLVGDPNDEGLKSEWAFVAALRGLYQIVPVPMQNGFIPDGLQALLLIHPKRLNERSAYALDQFLVRGGRLMVALDPFARSELNSLPSSQLQPSLASDFERFLSAWKLRFSTASIVGDRSRSSRMQTAHVSFDYPFLMQLTDEDVNKKHMISKQLRKGLSFLEAGYFELDPASPYRFDTLVWSSESSGLIPVEKANYMSPNQLSDELKPDGQKRSLVGLLVGQWQSIFAEAPASVLASPVSGLAAYQARAEQESAILLLGDVDFLADDKTVERVQSMDQMILKPKNDNLSLLMNGLEFITGHQDLIAIRSRGRESRTMSRLQEIREEANARYSEKVGELSGKLNEVEDKLKDYEALGNRVMTNDQKQAITDLRNKEAQLRRERREVHELMEADAARLMNILRVLHLLLLPLSVLLLGLGFPRARSLVRL